MSVTLAFRTEHIERVKDGSKRPTARYKFERQVKQGDELQFIDSSNSQIFGWAVATDAYDMEISQFVNTQWEYHTNYDDLEDLRDEFASYYPDVEIGENEFVTVIEWGNSFHRNREYYPTEPIFSYRSVWCLSYGST